MPQPDRPLQYPKELMAEVARSIRSYLDEQWGQYLHLFSGGPDSFKSQLDTIFHFAPHHKQAELHQHLDEWHKEAYARFAELYALADLLDGGQQRQGHTDQRTGRWIHLE